MIKILIISLMCIKLLNADIFNLTVKYVVDVIKTGTEEAYKNAMNVPPPQSVYEFKPSNPKVTDYGTFDYIVVGAGSAGAVIATRLSENDNLNILLLEAGGYEDAFNEIPGTMRYLQELRFNWKFKSVPQTTCCLGLIDKRCPHPRGKVLGGSSAINALMYVRGNRKNYDDWEKEGNPGWSYKDVLPYFKKSENSEVHHIEPEYHGKGGLWNVENYRTPNKQFYTFIEANRELGRNVFLDYNGREQLGVSATQLCTLNGRRQSTGRAFLSHANNRANLKILTEAFVTKVLIDNKKQAYGVSFDWKNRSYTAKVGKEVIVSAGAIMSPHLLMLSGIGPAKHLKKYNISVIQDLSGVGSNYQNHATYFGLHFTSNYTEPLKSDWELAKEFVEGYGPLTIPGNSQGVGFVQTKLAKAPGVPDIELILIPSNSTSNFLKYIYSYNNETWNYSFKKVNNPNCFDIYTILLKPKSRGTVRLKSASPYDFPLIDPRFLSDPKNKDIETMYEGIQLSLEMLKTEAFRKLNITLAYTPLPVCSHHEYLSKAFWYCQIRQLTSHMYHDASTCTMGPNPKTGAVVDHELKVHGIKGLRVADASIIPSMPAGHTSAVAVMIGEKLSDMLRGKSWKI